MHSWEDNPYKHRPRVNPGAWILKGGFDRNHVLTAIAPNGNILIYEIDKHNNNLIDASIERPGGQWVNNGILKKIR